jgi:cytoskeletal protein RodZ
MMDVGNELRKGRERRGISLVAVAKATKISVANLQAIERGDFARLPGGVFTRGFLRAFAHEVGLDPEETVQHYLSQFDPPQPAEPTSSDARSEQNVLSPGEMEELERQTKHKQLLAGAIVLLIGTVLYFAIFGRHSATTFGVAGQSPPAATRSPVTPEVGTTGAQEETRVASLAADRWAGKLHLEIEPAAECWVSALADGRQGLQRLLAAGEHEIIEATDEVILLVGDSLACSFSINGITAHHAGKPGQPATLRITRQNYREFLLPATPTAPAPPVSRNQ